MALPPPELVRRCDAGWPMLRPLRALRAVVALNILSRRAQEFVRGRVVAYVIAAVAVVGSVASLAVLDAERANP